MPTTYVPRATSPGRHASAGARRAAVAVGDDVVEQHRVDAALLEVDVGLLVALVELDVARLRAEDVVRERLVERADPLAAQIGERRGTALPSRTVSVSAYDEVRLDSSDALARDPRSPRGRSG